MRPIKLELTYIGPYENETIDFKDINQTLFLISGKTGSGKSMIFDAITHALFATASTSARGNESLRSQFAPSTEPSVITFTFMYRGKIYSVERRLRYFRGTNTTETPPESSIYNEFGEIIENGLTKVTTFITELLQLSATQFRQIGLLPQGEFRKFLVASSSEKEEILKALFRTERFNNLYLSLKKDYDADKQKIEMKHALIMNQFSQVLEEPSTSFKENLELFKNLQDNVSKELIETDKNYQKLLKTRDDLSTEILKIKENNERVETYFKEKNNLEKLLTNKPEIDKKEKQLQLSQKVQTIKDAFFNEKEYKKKVNDSEILVKETHNLYNEKIMESKKIRINLETLQKEDREINASKEKVKQISKYDTPEYQTIEKDIELIQKKIEKDNETLDRKQTELKGKEDSLSKIEVTDSLLRASEAELFTIKETLLNTKNEHDIAKEVEQNQQELNELTMQIRSIETEIDSLKVEVEKQNKDVQSLENISVQSINEMIHHLEVGKPCILCQQTVEQIPDSIVFDEALYRTLETKTKELETLKMKCVFLSKKEFKETRTKSELENEIRILNERLSSQEQKINAQSNELNKRHELELSLSEQKTEVSEISHKIDILEQELKSLVNRFSQFKDETNFEHFKDFKSVLKDMEEKIDTYDKKKKSLEEDNQALTLDMTKLESRLESAKFKLNMERSILEENSQKVCMFLSENNELSPEDLETLFEVDVESLKYTIETFHDQVTHIESLISHIKNDIETFEIVDLTDKKIEESKLSETINNESKALGQLESRTKTLEQLFNKIRSEIDVYKEEERAFTKLAQLVELLGGRQGTPTLSRFVLVYYLERILSQANVRLRKMTNGRYELRRVESYRSDQSLHIDVFDYFNNKRRSVATLSGGESFQASLALALALSEIIQHESGSIDMDMLLIDEGFGTLDEETLKVAIDTLFDLQKSGKMIGIISHVEELKTMIGNVLYVETLNERSQTRLVTPLSN